MPLTKLNKEERIFILVIACLLVLGGGFRLMYRENGLTLEVDPAVWAEANSSALSETPDDDSTSTSGKMQAGAEIQNLKDDSTKLANTVNINTASSQELTQLPGVGPVLAERIITYRTEKGLFLDGRQLLEIKGIGKITLERMLPYVTVKDED